MYVGLILEDMANLLVVEDEKKIRKVIKLSLESSGYKVTVARNGKEGLEYFEAHRYELVITDIKMPVMDGIEFVQSIRSSDRRDIPVIAITAFSETIELENGLFNSIVKKPFELKSLKRIISQHLGS